MHWRQNSIYREEVKFLTKILERVSNKGLMLAHYQQAFAEAYSAEPMEHKKENAARFAANTRIRELVKQDMQGIPIKQVDIPRVCGNCHWLDIQGICTAYNQYVPMEYLNEENKCEKYRNGVPF